MFAVVSLIAMTTDCIADYFKRYGDSSGALTEVKIFEDENDATAYFQILKEQTVKRYERKGQKIWLNAEGDYWWIVNDTYCEFLREIFDDEEIEEKEIENE